MKYVVYARKSTEDREDRQVISIESQIDAVAGKFPGLDIIEVITESKSAYKPNNREGFQRMVELFEEGKAEGLLAWHPDRLSREPVSAGQLIHLLDRGQIQDMKFASYHFDNSPEGKMMLSLVLSQSKYFSEKLSIDVKRGMVKKCQMGHRPCRAPLGYKADPANEKGAKLTLVDEERFPLVRQLWDLYLTGQYSVPELEQKAAGWGLAPRATKRRPSPKLHASSIYKILRNPFYAGQFEWDGKMYEGNHERMISIEEYEQAQKILGGRSHVCTAYAEAPYSSMFRCRCGELMYVDSCRKYKKGKPGKRYFYLRCKSQKKGRRMEPCGNKAISVVEVEKQVRSFLDSIEISPAFRAWINGHAGKHYHNEAIALETSRRNNEKEYRECIKRIERLTDAFISGMVDEDDFRKRKRVLFLQKEKIFAAKEDLNRGVDRSVETVEQIFSYAEEAAHIFATGSLKRKQEVLAKVGANFIIDDRKVTFEAEKWFLKIREQLPQIRRLEAVCEPPESGLLIPNNSLNERLIGRWSSLLLEVRTLSLTR